MADYVGDPIFLWVKASDPLTNVVITDATVTFDLYEPPKNPRANVDDRANPEATFDATFDEALGIYSVVANTAGFAPGKWWARAGITRPGEGVKHEFMSFKLKA